MKIIFLLFLITKTSVSQFAPVKRVGLVPVVPPELCQVKGCLYEGTDYPLGSVIDCNCIQLICSEDGWIEKINENCCLFNGRYYEEGFILKFGCFLMNCSTSGTWDFNGIKEECVPCYVSTDPNIFTFDGLSYRWNGICNYTLTQPYHCDTVCESYFPPYAVYGQFAPCVGGAASCVDITTYKVNPHTAVEIYHSALSSITINGNTIVLPSNPIMPTDPNGYPYPLFAWFDGYCTYVIGLQYSVIACPTFLIIFALTETSIYGVSGLCGFFSHDPSDDFQPRECVPPYSLSQISEFVESWMTLEMDFNCKCSKLTTPTIPISATRGKREVPDCDQKYRQKCQDIANEAYENCGLTNKDVTQFVIESCVSDCCQEPKYFEFWQNEAEYFACFAGNLSQLQRGRET